MKILSEDKVLNCLKSGDRIFIHTAACAPALLIKLLALKIRNEKLTGIKIYHLHTEGEVPYAHPDFKDRVEVNCFFVGSNMRKAVQEGRASYIPVFLSEVPLLFKENIIPLDLSLIQVTPPDAFGLVSLGPAVDATAMAVRCSKTVVAQINNKMPFVFGDGIIHEKDIHYGVEGNYDLPTCHSDSDSPSLVQIAKHVTSLIDNGSTLQMGIGDIPNAVLNSLGGHKNLGIHTEMFSDNLIPLIESGVVNGKNKKIHPHKVVSSFAMGTKKLYDYINRNSHFLFMSADFVNDPRVIQKNPQVIAINSAIEIDLTGQVCADSIGEKIYSGVGGQVDFIRGASLSQGGRPIIAINSQTQKGKSKIVSNLSPGAGVVTSRAHIHFVVTEFGIANLFGKNLKERAVALINISHPDDRERLLKEAFDRKLIFS